jgi:hypothetical protein
MTLFEEIFSFDFSTSLYDKMLYINNRRSCAEITEQGSGEGTCSADDQSIYLQNSSGAEMTNDVYDGGATFEDDYYAYNPNDGDNSGSFDSSQSYTPEEIGIELNTVYQTGNETYNFFYFDDNGYVILCDPVAETTIDLNYEIYGDEVTLYDGAGTVVAEMTFDGYSFYEEDSELSYYPQ